MCNWCRRHWILTTMALAVFGLALAIVLVVFFFSFQFADPGAAGSKRRRQRRRESDHHQPPVIAGGSSPVTVTAPAVAASEASEAMALGRWQRLLLQALAVTVATAAAIYITNFINSLF